LNGCIDIFVEIASCLNVNPLSNLETIISYQVFEYFSYIILIRMHCKSEIKNIFKISGFFNIIFLLNTQEINNIKKIKINYGKIISRFIY